MSARDPAFPQPDVARYLDPNAASGLTRRELFAAMAMQGLLAESGAYMEGRHHILSKAALAHADSLIKELER